MRADAELLWQQAVEAGADARALIHMHRWALACFSCEQAVQLGIKALIVERTGRPHPRIHKLEALGLLVSASRPVQKALKVLDPFYLKTRYPDISGKVPAKLFTSDDAGRARAAARTALVWIAADLGTHAPDLGSR